jgi:hypothetical protein
MSGFVNSANMAIVKPLNGYFLKFLSLPETELFLNHAINAVKTETDFRDVPAIMTDEHPQIRILNFKDADEKFEAPRSPRRKTKSPPRSPRPFSSAEKKHGAVPKSPSQSQQISRFFFPEGKTPLSNAEQAAISDVFRAYNVNVAGLSAEQFFPVTMRICELSSYCNTALFNKILAANQVEVKDGQTPLVSEVMFTRYWRENIQGLPTYARLFRILRRHNYSTYLNRQDFVPVVQEIVKRHPGELFGHYSRLCLNIVAMLGLEFLEQTPKFQLR